MSSPNIKFQSLIRKYKSGVKETIDKQKIIRDFTYQLNIDDAFDTSYLFNSKGKKNFIYTLDDLFGYNKKDVKVSLSKPIKIPPNIDTKNQNTETPDDLLFSFSPGVESLSGPNGQFNPLHNFNINNPYLNNCFKKYTADDGYLKTVYNAELCDRDWVIFMYFINRIYANFATHDKIKIKSIHLHITPGSELSAMHHFLYNSKVNNSILNIEWDWLGTVYNNSIRSNDPYNIKKQVYIKYKNNMLPLFNTDISSSDNVNFILNESLSKLSKANFLCVDKTTEIKDLMFYGILSVKLLEVNCLFYLKLPAINEWDVHIINALLLYSLIFTELYLFKIDIDNKKSVVLLCKNKKKIAIDNSYKKLLYLLNNADFTNPDQSCNIFSLEYLKSENIKNWLENVLAIIEKELECDGSNKLNDITFEDTSYEMTKVLEVNTNTFL